MAGLFGRKSNGATPPQFGSLRVQSSMYGLAIPVVYGRTRVTGNLIWYGDFKATKHESRSDTGKGGSSPAMVSYTYSASVMMALGEGPILGVRNVWYGKQQLLGAADSSRKFSTVETLTIPSVGPYTVTVSQAATFSESSSVLMNGTWSDSWVGEGVDFTRSGGVYTFNSVYAGQTVRIGYTFTAGPTDAINALPLIGLTLKTGGTGQTTWPYLTTNFAAQALSYAGLSYVYAQDYALNDQAQVENHSFEVEGRLQYSATIPDCDPSVVVRDILLSPTYGAGAPSTFIGDLTSYSQYCVANTLFVSPAYTEQRQVRDVLAELIEATNADAAWNGSALRIIPRGDATVTGNGVTYTPNNTPVYSIGIDDLLVDDGADAVQVSRVPVSDVYNRVTAEFAHGPRGSDLGNSYNLEPVEVKDEASILTYGLRPEASQTWHFFARADSAMFAAQIRLQRIQARRRRYDFTLPWRFMLLEPGDLVSLTEPRLGLSGVIAKVTSIEERDDDTFSVQAEDFPVGHANAPLIPSQTGAGYAPNFNVSPGSVNTPIIWEPPYSLSGTPQIWAAVSGGADWGGAVIWASTDGTTYARMGEATKRARHGLSTATLNTSSTALDTTNTLSVSLASALGNLASGTNSDADSYVTLCLLDSEYLAFTTATLTSAYNYNLTRLQRGAFGSTIAPHPPNAKFVRIDDGIVRLDYDASLIGKTLYLKFQSYNRFGNGLQDISTCAVYTYTVIGPGADGSPPGVSANLVPNAALRFGSYPWARTNDSGGITAGAGWSWQQLPASNANSPTPYGCIGFWTAATTDSTFAYAAGASTYTPVGKLPAVVGQRYDVQVRAKIYGGTSKLQVWWCNAAGSVISSVTPTGGVSESTNQSTGGSSSNLISSFDRLYGFVTAPANAVSAMIVVQHARPATGVPSYFFTGLPYWAEAFPSQLLPAAWAEGEGAVDSDQIASLAATEVVRATITGVAWASGTDHLDGPGGSPIGTATWTNNLSTDVVCSVTLSSSVQTMYGSVDNPSYCDAYLVLTTSGGSPSTWTAPAGRTKECFSGDAFGAGAITLIGSITVPAGSTLTAKYSLYRYNRTSSSPNTYNTVNVTDSIVRIEAIKK